MFFICQNCIRDADLKKLAEDEWEEENCSECGSIGKLAISTERLGSIIEVVLRRLYYPRDIYPVISDDSEKISYVQSGETMSFIIQEIIGQYFECMDELVKGVIDADEFDPRDGGEPYWDASASYERIVNVYEHVIGSWESTLFELKHSRRFFSPSANVLFSHLFADLGKLRVLRGRMRSQSVVRVMPAGTILFRARVSNILVDLKKASDDPLDFVGPPPQEKARAGRMNAEGVVVLYCAQDEETCLAEMRPVIGGEIALIKLESQEDLRILDFALLEKALIGDSPGYFDPNYFKELERRKLLQRLHQLISQPVIPGHEADYLITQTMAEYLSHVHESKIDGISFSSAQRADGVNVVLFPARDVLQGSIKEKFGVEYVDKSLAFFRTEAIKYRHSPMEVYETIEDYGNPLGMEFNKNLDELW